MENRGIRSPSEFCQDHHDADLGRSSAVRASNDHLLDLAEVADRLVVEVERGLDHVGGREGEPLREADVLELGYGGTERQWENDEADDLRASMTSRKRAVVFPMFSM